MKATKFINGFIDLQGYARWRKFHPSFKDNTASHSYKAAVYALVASLLQKEKYGQDINIEGVVCSTLFQDMHKLIIGHMNYNTKKRMARFMPRIIKDANVKIVSNLSDISTEMYDFFYDTMVALDHLNDFEKEMVETADLFEEMIFCYREMKDGSKSPFFKETFEEIAKKMRESKIEAFRYMMAEFDQKGAFFNFLYEVMMLDQIERWDGRTNLVYDTDTEHSFRATALAIFFALLEKYKYGKKIDVLRLVGKVLCHDIPEIRTGDVNGPFKHSIPELKEEFEIYEKETAMDIVEQLPVCLHSFFTDYMVNAKDETYEGKLVDVVDKVDALIKANLERQINAKVYEASYREQLEKIQLKFDNPCAIYFLAYVLHDMGNPNFQK